MTKFATHSVHSGFFSDAHGAVMPPICSRENCLILI